MSRPSCYPATADSGAQGVMPLLDVLTSPVPAGRFDSRVDHRHVLCLHLGAPVAVTYREGRHERAGTRLHGQFCVVPAGSSTRWSLTAPATSLLLRLSPDQLRETADTLRTGAALAPSIHIRDPQIERIGWMMRAEEHAAHPGGRLFADSLAGALAARLLMLSQRAAAPRRQSLPAWRLRQVIEYVDANLDRDLGLAELAAIAGFSVSHFTLLFKAATGTPVHRFVLERRVECARQRLQAGRQSTTDIALDTGFAHASHMARTMRAILGLCPADIRRHR